MNDVVLKFLEYGSSNFLVTYLLTSYHDQYRIYDDISLTREQSPGMFLYYTVARKYGMYNKMDIVFFFLDIYIYFF